jgi:hypothetical protein
VIDLAGLSNPPFEAIITIFMMIERITNDPKTRITRFLLDKPFLKNTNYS